MSAWDEESVEATLREKGWLVDSREIDYGKQFDLIEGVKVNVYHTGRVTFGGPRSEFKDELQQYFASKGPVTRSARTPDATTTRRTRIEESKRVVEDEGKRVFVVYGHDTEARRDLELLLRRVRVEPIILENIPGVGETLIEKLESLTDADFACVLLTPDDIGSSAEKPDDLRPRARQNVVLEMGMVLSRLGRRRVAILVKGSNLEKPSDIDGLIYIPFQTTVSEAANALGAALATAGFQIDIRDLLGS